MHLRRLALRNFGVYRGEQVIELSVPTGDSPKRPVVLVGGHNGAGKTTILDAVRLCLYGRLSLGARVTDAAYHAYLRDMIHRAKDVIIPIGYASVRLEFEYSIGGRKSIYDILRAWEPRGALGVSESLRVMRDGQPLADVDAHLWPEFVKTLVPPGVAQLFFFDGEKIKRLAEEDSEADTLAESIKSLLGLDLVERLQADLDLYTSRYLKKTATSSLAKRLGELEKQESALTGELEQLHDAEINLRARVDELLLSIDRMEQKLASRGEGLASQRGELKQRRIELEKRRDEEEARLRELCDGALPFAFCPRWSAALLAQLNDEARLERWEASRVEIAEALAEVGRRLSNRKLASELGITGAAKSAIAREISGTAERYSTIPPDLRVVETVHGLSARVREQAEQVLHSALNVLPKELTETAVALTRAIDEAREVQELLNRAPQADELAPMVRELSSLQEENAREALDLSLKLDRIAKATYDRDQVRREKTRILQTQSETAAAASRISVAGTVRRALDDYLIRLTTAKVDELQVAALKCFQTLSRKTDLVHDIRIDPRSFGVSLFDGGGNAIPKAGLSAGEKQIYAISLMWALTKVSGRALPMIVDTPLGRLDSVHRKHLLERYFPVASHQIVILSTDTEVDRSTFASLKRHTSHAINLQNHGAWTEASSGYFWAEEEANV